MAQATKLSASYLSELEHARTKPTLETLVRLAAGYGLSVVDLLAGVDLMGTPSMAGLAPGLSSLLEQGLIDEVTAWDLGRIQLRGHRPQTADEWYELYLHVRRIIRPYLLKGDDDVSRE